MVDSLVFFLLSLFFWKLKILVDVMALKINTDFLYINSTHFIINFALKKHDFDFIIILANVPDYSFSMILQNYVFFFNYLLNKQRKQSQGFTNDFAFL